MKSVSKYVFFSVTLVVGVILQCWAPTQALAAIVLKQVQVSNSDQVDLLFDGKMNRSQIQTEFFNDIIQVSLVDVTVYPAKISSVNGGVLTKVFAYQYSPRLVRCRLTVSGKAEDYKDRFVLNTNGKMITLKMLDPRVSNTQKQESPRVAMGPEMNPASQVVVPAKIIDKSVADMSVNVDDKKLVNKPVAAQQQHHVNSPIIQEQVKNHVTERKFSKVGQSLGSPFVILSKLAFVVAVFLIFSVILRRVMRERPEQNEMDEVQGVPDREIVSALNRPRVSHLFASLGRFARVGLSRMGRKEGMIEVLSTHHLGPKQRIAVVRVCGKKMVLGIANDSISLISQLPDGIDQSRNITPGSDVTGTTPSSFSQFLNTENSNGLGSDGVRARVRSRLEGLKPL